MAKMPKRLTFLNEKFIKPQLQAKSLSREDAGAAVSDEQMRFERPRYPVDRYLVDSSKKVEMVNILDGEIWNSEPALKPEDEIILRKLHDMLQSTADDLKLLSGELNKFHEPGVRFKSQPTPLDEEFNEKVHIEEIVNAKFHGYKFVEESLPFSSEPKPKKDIVTKMLASKNEKPKAAVNASVQVNSISLLKKPMSTKNLQSTRPKVVQIKEDNIIGFQDNTLNDKRTPSDPLTVSYNEIVHKYADRKKEHPKKILQIQNMPSINIRSEFKEQKVLHLDILPDCINNTESFVSKNNVGVISVQHEYSEIIQPKNKGQEPQSFIGVSNRSTIRKVSKITSESSESTNNLSSEVQQKLEKNRHIRISAKIPKTISARVDNKNKKLANTKKSHSNLDEWKKKLNSAYGQQVSTKTRSTLSKTKKLSPIKSNCPFRNLEKSKTNTLNNIEYIPYSQLTLGGVRVGDIEREISEFPNKNDLPLSSIVDKILNSQDDFSHEDKAISCQLKNSPKILTTSDENLLQEVMEIEKTISETLSKSFNDKGQKPMSEVQHESKHSGDSNSYADDFENDKSEPTESSQNQEQFSSGKSRDDVSELSHEENIDEHNENEKLNADKQEKNIQNTTYTKASNLSFKGGVDIFEYVHSVDTHDTGTQSNTARKISLKQTQTSPRNDSSNIQPIHNDLWPSIDPKGEVEKLFKLEKEFIKKLIVDEYGEILEKNITKPSTSNEKDRADRTKNVAAFQKNTQTSPAHVKCVTTSPTRTKTRTTSPFSLYTIDRHTSPIEVSNEDEIKNYIDSNPEDIGISVNLSSPRFSLRLPQNSREVMSNLDSYSRSSNKINDEGNNVAQESKTFRKYDISSSSSVDADNFSSDISSLGEVKLKLRKKIKKCKDPSVLTSSSSSIVSRSSDTVFGEILPLKSEGELSLGQTAKKSRGRKESDGEMNTEAM